MANGKVLFDSPVSNSGRLKQDIGIVRQWDSGLKSSWSKLDTVLPQGKKCNGDSIIS